MTKLEFTCNKCNDSFNLEVKEIEFGEKGKWRIEEEMICPRCGLLENEEYLFEEEKNKTAVGELFINAIKKKQIHEEKHKLRKEALKNYRPGQMFEYQKIFSEEEFLSCRIDNQNYFFLDCYCVMPDCPCTDAAIYIIDPEDTKSVKTPLFSFSLNYKTKKVEAIFNIESKKLKEIVDSIPEETFELLEVRHNRLKENVHEDILHILKKYTKKKPPKKNPPKKVKVGRNEPCPCGSGIKYKRCCIDKE